MILLYCSRRSQGATEIVRILQARGINARVGTNPRAGEHVVNWGQLSLADNALNARIAANKCHELALLHRGGVPSVRFWHSFDSVPLNSPTVAQRLCRSFYHTGARDLRFPRKARSPFFYTEFVLTTHEFRVHVFRNRILRVALKVAKPNAHPWIRSHGCGWRFSYGADCQRLITDRVRQAARSAIAALQYDFGAVDVGVKDDGTPVVFEVNSAPGFDEGGRTAEKYAACFAKWAATS